MSDQRDGYCVCGAPVEAHFDARNLRLSCAQARAETICEHGIAYDCHCCDCGRSGFMFDTSSCVCWRLGEPRAVPPRLRLVEKRK